MERDDEVRILTYIENAISGFLFLVGIGISLYAIFMRYVVGMSFSWATEFYTMFLVWAIFIGFSTALRDDKHIAIDILYDRVGANVQKIFELIALIFGSAFSIFFIWAGVEVVISAYNQGSTTIDAGFPIWINYLILPISGVLLLIRLIEKTFLFFKKGTTDTKEDDSEWQQ